MHSAHKAKCFTKLPRNRLYPCDINADRRIHAVLWCELVRPVWIIFNFGCLSYYFPHFKEIWTVRSSRRGSRRGCSAYLFYQRGSRTFWRHERYMIDREGRKMFLVEFPDTKVISILHYRKSSKRTVSISAGVRTTRKRRDTKGRTEHCELRGFIIYCQQVAFSLDDLIIHLLNAFCEWGFPSGYLPHLYFKSKASHTSTS